LALPLLSLTALARTSIPAKRCLISVGVITNNPLPAPFSKLAMNLTEGEVVGDNTNNGKNEFQGKLVEQRIFTHKTRFNIIFTFLLYHSESEIAHETTTAARLPHFGKREVWTKISGKASPLGTRRGSARFFGGVGGF
jgi:hypothetical protein